MKNVYKKSIKLMDKSAHVIISRYDDHYNVTDGYIMLKVPTGAYDAFFRTEKPYYVGLADGETWISEKKGRKSCIGSKKPEFVNLDKCFPDPCDAVQVRPTAYKYTASGTTCDVFASEEFITCINSEFVAAFSEIYGHNFKSAGKTRPLVWGGNEAITLPVNVSIPEEMESALINSVW